MRKALYAFFFSALTLVPTINTTASTLQSYQHIDYLDLNKEQRKQVDCLAQNMYREAGGESDKGLLAIGLVTMNRVKSELFEPKSVCGIVRQKVNSTCQFSWVCHKKLPNLDLDRYNDVRDLAARIYIAHDKIHDFTKGALYFHSNSSSPGWKRLVLTTKIGKHLFYKPHLTT